MSKILAIAGKKTCGKTTLCNFLHGYQLKAYGIIEDFDLTDKGKLVIKANTDSGEVAHGQIDIMRRDLEFGEWAAYNMWPFVKQYSFASALKEMCLGLFNIPWESIYGTNDQKEQKIEHLKWENMPGVLTPDKIKNNGVYLTGEYGYPEAVQHLEGLGLIIHPEGMMTGREFMQFLGTEVMRKMYDNVWCENTIGQVLDEEPQLALIDDARFSNEVQTIKDAGGKIIQLIRVDNDDAHASENGLEGIEFDAVIDARNMDMVQMCTELVAILENWGWFNDLPKEQ